MTLANPEPNYEFLNVFVMSTGDGILKPTWYSYSLLNFGNSQVAPYLSSF